jgi:hypothetical protein
VAGAVPPLLELPAVELAADASQCGPAQEAWDQDLMIALEALLQSPQVIELRRRDRNRAGLAGG